MRKYLNDKPILVVALIVVLAFFFDFLNLDSSSYKVTCNVADTIFDLSCPDYYDLPIWQAAATFGSLAALYFAYRAITQSNLQLEAEQTPYVVMKGHIGMANNNQTTHIVMFENIGKGLAANIRLTADPQGKISAIDGSNPHTVNLGSGQYNNGWAVDEHKIILGLQQQGLSVTNSVINEIPDENVVANPDEADFFLYFWYSDQPGNRYCTETKIRHSGHFLKVMENKVKKL